MDEVLAQILLLSIGLGFLFWLQTAPAPRREQGQKSPLSPPPARLVWSGMFSRQSPPSALIPPYVLWAEALPPQISPYTRAALQGVVLRLTYEELKAASPALWQDWPLQAIEVMAGADFQHSGEEFLSSKQAWQALFSDLPFRAQAGFAQPQSLTQQAWNDWLRQHQFHLEGYVLDISEAIAHFPLETLARHLQTTNQALLPGQGLALHCTLPVEGLGELTDSLWALWASKGLAYLSLASPQAEALPAAAFFWQYLTWSQSGREWQRFHQAGEEALPVFIWQKDWELGAWLHNAQAKSQVVWLEDQFPENFYVAMFSGDNFESLPPQKSKNKLVLPPQTWAWLSTHPLPMLGPANPKLHIRRSAPAQIEVRVCVQKTGFVLYLRLVNAQGQEVFAWGKKAARAGTFYLDLEVPRLPAGLYYWIQELDGQCFWQAWEYLPDWPSQWEK
ncbi:MAG: hypothetical protein OHK0053_11080 [Microscillaceae bacterium]